MPRIALFIGMIGLTTAGCATGWSALDAPELDAPQGGTEGEPQGGTEGEPQRGTEAERRATLDEYGQWVASSQYGQVWQPASVAATWRPYTRGHWVYRRAGWTWASDYPWGWVAFHYGRWVYDPVHGWVWVPGDTWGPAWVAWTYTDAYIGWAPLPPNVGVGWAGTLANPYWCYTNRGYFGRRRFRPRVYPVDENPRIATRARIPANVPRQRAATPGTHPITSVARPGQAKGPAPGRIKRPQGPVKTPPGGVPRIRTAPATGVRRLKTVPSAPGRKVRSSNRGRARMKPSSSRSYNRGGSRRVGRARVGRKR